MKETGLRYTAEMVRAYFAGLKTQTRRIVKFSKHSFTQPLRHVEYARDGMPIWWDSPPSDTIRNSDYYDHGCPCPFGVVGDVLYGRECWGITAARAHGYWLNGEILEGAYDLLRRDVPLTFHYRADGEIEGMRWRPSIHMPRVAARIIQPITSIRVERLQDMRGADVAAEGFPFSSDLDQFKQLWESIYPGSWERNDHVWVLGFPKYEAGQ